MNVRERINAYDAMEIAAKFCGLKEDDYDDDEVENALAEKHDISLECFTEIVQWCFDRIGVDVSPAFKTTYVGFADGIVWLVKKDVSGPIINFVLNWILEGQGYNDKGAGHERVITKDGKPEFKILITRAENKVTVTKPDEASLGDYKKKAEKWDALSAKIAKFYPDGSGDEGEEGDLIAIGEVAAAAFGYL